MRQYRFGDVVVLVDDERETLTHVWPDGVTLVATSNPTDPAHVGKAWAFGYRGDTWAMSKAHELAHQALAVLDGLPWSPTLRCLALGGDCDHGDAHGMEEVRVAAFQNWTNWGCG